MKSLLSFASTHWITFIVGLIGAILGFAVILCTKRIIKFIKRKHSLKEKAISLPKIALGLLFAIMALIVLIAFFVSDPKFNISNGLICILGLMIFIVFSDSIEDFSIANLVTLKKEVKTKTEEVSKLSSENTELRTQLTSIVSASIHNQNLNNVVLGFGDSFLKYARVEQVNTEDDSTTPTSDSPADSEQSSAEHSDTIDRPSSSYLRTQFFRYAEPVLISKYAALEEVPLESVQQHVRLANYLDAKDPIMEHRAIFDAYIKRPLEELFIEATYIATNINAYYRWYYMISLILQYAKLNKKSAKLVLLTPNIPSSIQAQLYNGGLGRNLDREFERVRNNFQPAIQNGFLEIVVIDFTEEECQSILDKLRSN